MHPEIPFQPDIKESFGWEAQFDAAQIISYVELFRFFQFTFYHLYYALSLMHSIDIHVMVCEPMKYAEFCQIQALMKHLGLGFAISLGASADHLVNFLIKLIRLNGDLSNTRHLMITFDIIRALDVFTAIKMIIMKTVYSMIVIRLALKTKASLNESESMTANQAEGERRQQRKTLHRRLFHFSLIPLFLNFLFLVYEIFDIGRPFVKLERQAMDCVAPHLFSQFWVQMVITAVVFTVGSFSYVIGCLVLFPKVREAIREVACCCFGQNVQ